MLLLLAIKASVPDDTHLAHIITPKGFSTLSPQKYIYELKYDHGFYLSTRNLPFCC